MPPCAVIFPASAVQLLALLVIAAQAVWIYLAYRRAKTREALFRIITENAADMIALVDTKGRRLYNSPAYQRVLGYSAPELAQTSVFEQIHPDDRFKLLEAAREASASGVGKSLQYRLRHKNGSWRILESTASTIRNDRGEVESWSSSTAMSPSASKPKKNSPTMRCTTR
jgi:PAS domain S-box-containing protein